MVLETILGGRAFRPDPGELCVAVRTPDGKSFELVEPAGASPLHVPLTDAGVIAALERIEGNCTPRTNTAQAVLRPRKMLTGADVTRPRARRPARPSAAAEGGAPDRRLLAG